MIFPFLVALVHKKPYVECTKYVRITLPPFSDTQLTEENHGMLHPPHLTLVYGFGAIFLPVASGTVVVCKNNTRVLGRSGPENII